MAVIDVSAIKGVEYSIERAQNRIRQEVWLDVYAGDFQEEGRLVWDEVTWADFDIIHKDAPLPLPDWVKQSQGFPRVLP